MEFRRSCIPASCRPIGEPLRGHGGGVAAVAMVTLGGGTVNVSGSDHGTVLVWDLIANQITSQMEVGSKVQGLAVTQEGSTIVLSRRALPPSCQGRYHP